MTVSTRLSGTAKEGEDLRRLPAKSSSQRAAVKRKSLSALDDELAEGTEVFFIDLSSDRSRLKRPSVTRGGR